MESEGAYDEEEVRELEQLADLARAFRESAERALVAVDRTNKEFEQTIRQLRRSNTARLVIIRDPENKP
jgi:hypothetical protein